MKIAENFVEENAIIFLEPNDSAGLRLKLVALFREIQLDALQAAINECEKQYEDDDCEAGHANRGVGNCADAIRLLEKETRGQSPGRASRPVSQP